MFSESQKKIISSALTCISVVIITLFTITVFKVLGSFISAFSAAIYPLVLACVFFIMVKPVIDFLDKKFNMSRTLSIVILYFAISLIFILFFAFIFPQIVAQIECFFLELPDLLNSLINNVFEKFPEAKETLSLKVKEFFENFFKDDFVNKISTGASILINTTGSIFGFCAALAGFAVTPIYLFYMLESKRDIYIDLEENTKWINPKMRRDLKFLISQFIGILTAFFRGQMLIAIIMGVLFGIGFAICDIKLGFTIGLFMGILNIVPYLGSIIGLITVISVAAFQNGGGGYLIALALVVICIVQLIESYLLTPKIMKKQTGLHPGVIIFSIFFWGVALKGIIGMILAVPLTAFIVVFWRLLKEKYLKNSQEIELTDENI